MTNAKQNVRQRILAAVEEMKAWDQDVHLDALVQDTGIVAAKISTSISLMRHEGFPIEVTRREGRKNVAWKFAKAAGDTSRASDWKRPTVKVSDVTTNQIVVVRHLEAAGFGQEVPIAHIVAGTGLKVTAIKKVVENIRLEKGGCIEVIKPGLYKLHEHEVHKTARQVRAESSAAAKQRAGALKPVPVSGHGTMREAANAKGYTDEDLEYGRRVLLNYDRLPQEVRDKIEAFKEVAPEFTEDLEKLLVKVLGVTPEQDADPSFWSVDQFADGSLMLARKDGTHWKATKL